DLPEADTKTTHFAMLTRMRAKDVLRYGTKASNLGEIVTANLDGVHVPPGFGVPFFYYVQHMQKNGLDKKVTAMLENPKFKSDAAWRKDALDDIRKAI